MNADASSTGALPNKSDAIGGSEVHTDGELEWVMTDRKTTSVRQCILLCSACLYVSVLLYVHCAHFVFVLLYVLIYQEASVYVSVCLSIRLSVFPSVFLCVWWAEVSPDRRTDEGTSGLQFYSGGLCRRRRPLLSKRLSIKLHESVARRAK